MPCRPTLYVDMERYKENSLEFVHIVSAEDRDLKNHSDVQLGYHSQLVDLQRSHTTYQPEEYRRKYDPIAKIVQAIGEEVTARQQAAGKEKQNALLKLKAFVTQIAKKLNASSVITTYKTEFLFLDEEFDITNRVVEQLNNEYISAKRSTPKTCYCID